MHIHTCSSVEGIASFAAVKIRLLVVYCSDLTLRNRPIHLDLCDKCSVKLRLLYHSQKLLLRRTTAYVSSHTAIDGDATVVLVARSESIF